MFTNYKIENNVLYLYVDYNYEIGSFFDKSKNKNIVDNIRKYIKDKKIKFNGYKVVLLLSGLLVGTVYLNRNINSNYEVYSGKKYVYNIVDRSIPEISTADKLDNEITNVVEEAYEDSKINNNEVKTNQNKSAPNKNTTKKSISNITSNQSSTTTNVTDNNTSNSSVSADSEVSTSNEEYVTLHRTNGSTIKLTIDDYLAGVVAAEMPASFGVEALKAQAVVARTYTYKLINSNRKLTDDVKTQVYKSNDELKSMWKGDYDKYYNKVRNAVLQTKDEVITYNGQLIDAVYHSTSNGYTEDSVNVWNNSYPYLKSVVSPWDTSASSFERTVTITYGDISRILGIDFNSSSIITVIARNDSNRIAKISFDNKEYTGVEIRNLLGLRSADFDFYMTDNGVSFKTRGYGHGVGMSQYGANGMANAGYNYKQIINYYYTNVNINDIKNI